jgi:hypothetical protein
LDAFCSPGSGDPVTGCRFYADNTACNDSVACTGDYCDPNLGCSHIAQNYLCNDNNATTSDVCSAVSDCSNPAAACGEPPSGELPLPDGGLSFAFAGNTASAPTYDTSTWVQNTPSGNCVGSPSVGSPDRIYSFTLTNYSKLHLDTLTTTQFDSVVYVRNACSAGTQVACNDDVAGGFNGRQSSLDAVLSPGTYYAWVDGYTSSASGAYTLNASITPNDTCASPFDVSAGGTFTGSTYYLKNDYTPTTTTNPSTTNTCFSGAGSGPEAVFQTTIPGNYTQLHVSTLGSAIDTVLYVRSGSCATGTQLGCSDDARDVNLNPIGVYSDLTVPVTAGQTYYIFVDSSASQTGGSWVLNVNYQ